MSQKKLFEIGLILIIVAGLLVLFLRHNHTKKWTLELKEVLDLIISVLMGVSGCYVMYQSYNLFDELSKLVSFEGAVAMFVGGFTSVWFGFGKIQELIDKP